MYRWLAASLPCFSWRRLIRVLVEVGCNCSPNCLYTHAWLRYGILLWEMATLRVAWSEELGSKEWIDRDDLEFFQKEIALSGRRPTIPKQVGDGECNIMELCWKHAPEDRPVFWGILADFQVMAGLEAECTTRECCSIHKQVSDACVKASFVRPSTCNVFDLDPFLARQATQGCA